MLDAGIRPAFISLPLNGLKLKQQIHTNEQNLKSLIHI